MQRQLLVKTRGLVAIAAAILATIIVVRLLAKDAEPPRDIELKWVKIVVLSENGVVTSRLESGAHFFVRYDAVDQAENERLRPSVLLELRRDGKAVNNLINDGGPIRVVPPGATRINSLGLRGSGPREFKLPELRSGWYQLCGGISRDIGEQREEHGLFCKTFTVVDR